MAVTVELTTLHRTVAELRGIVDTVRSRYGDIPAVKRLVGDLDRIDLDAAELDEVLPPANGTGPAWVPVPLQMHVVDDTPHDPSLWADADDEGLGGYHR